MARWTPQKKKKRGGLLRCLELLRAIYFVYLRSNDCDVHSFLSRASRRYQFPNAWGKPVLVGKAN
ncbi:MAG: hypothetical protein CM1200mP41_22620 [Gammaproteobacteria bacterium]|nr:MAG: hypothetical protein CM1200mP41_22620 [Gammaproteobacteria bacterium]